ncbi:unnamed protein product [Euphydryas editha]|uniref:Uncharacterized protein n=1 Tax=Euphydryas editha TaxID=104508 RepID=A0AAU9UAA5_EUPED|nr:unnamed protein product [Euphydryas editha]
MSSLEKEAKENVYAVHEPHIQYELTINKHGEPPKYLSLSKPLTHQRTHAFDPQHFKFKEINNNFFNENNLPTFKSDQRNRKSDRSYKRNNKNRQCYSCQSNQDIKYSIDPNFGMVRASEKNYMSDAQNIRNNTRSSLTNKSRIYERNNSGRKNATRKIEEKDTNFKRIDSKRVSNGSKKVKNVQIHNRPVYENEKERSFEELKAEQKLQDDKNKTNSMPRTGKVREIASKFDRNSCENFRQAAKEKVERPKSIQSYDQAYLDHVFPDAVEI